MELKEFIKTAITDITSAISELQSELKNGAIVNPSLPNSISTKTLTVNDEIIPIERLNFDVAVTATETTGIGGEAKAGISIFGVKAGTESNSKTENVSRLTFSVPIAYPSAKVKSKKETTADKHREVLERYHSRNEK